MINNTSNSLDNVLTPALRKILLCIKTHGSITTATLAKTLQMSNEAVRQHVQKLLENQWIIGQQDAIQQAGRPKQHWMISETGNQLFPDGHAYLTVQLLESIQHVFGESGLEKLIIKREKNTTKQYQMICSGQTLHEKMQQLVQIRSEEGYMAELQSDGTDFVFIENHCPICAAATQCQQFCRSELQLFQTLLREHATIQREQHILKGNSRCIYRITPL